jgi:hypothetical protein
MIELINAYKNTDYIVYNPSLVIKIGVKNQALDSLLKALNATTWAYITAFNPYSKLLSEASNRRRHEILKTKIENYRFYEGEGVGEDKKWKPEISLLILGISLEEAMEVGNCFEQNAIVVGEIYGIPELKMLV